MPKRRRTSAATRNVGNTTLPVRKRRVLIVDDHEDTRALYGAYLRQSGWDVEEAANGNEALHVVQSFAPDVIVMDLAMTELDGAAAVERLKRDVELRKIPIVVLTAHPAKSQDVALAGCDDLLLKPCMPSDLQDALLRVVRASNHRGGDG